MSGVHRAAAAVEELRSVGLAGPFASSRMLGPACFHVVRRHGRVSVESLWVSRDARGQGVGTALLSVITDAADKHGAQCCLRARPYDGSPLKLQALREWYARQGFQPVSARSTLMVREPREVTR